MWPVFVFLVLATEGAILPRDALPDGEGVQAAMVRAEAEAALMKLLTTMTDEEIASGFSQFDASADNRIDANELRGILAHVSPKYQPADEDLNRIILAFDTDSSGAVDLKEVMSFVSKLRGQGQVQGDLNEISHDYRSHELLKARMRTRDVCGFASGCPQCSALDGCVWCHDDNACYAGDVNGPFPQPDDKSWSCSKFDYQWCPGLPCAAATLCQACKQPVCGWCQESGQCIQLNFRGEPIDIQNGTSASCLGSIVDDCRH